MPIEKTMADAILGTFRTMYNDLAAQNLSGEAFDRMKAALDKMEQYAAEMDDMTSFSTRLNTEGLYVGFSTAYGEVLAEEGRKKYSKVTDDSELLEMTIKSYQDSIVSLKDTPAGEKIIPLLQEVIALGRSGISYPVFLRTCEEKGIYRAMDGSALTLDALETEREIGEMFPLPVYLKKANVMIAYYKELAAKSPFGMPDSFLLGLHRILTDWEYAPEDAMRSLKIRLWDKLLELMNDWVDAHCDFAPHDDRWADVRGMEYTMKNIRRTKECNPGFFRYREKILGEYFGMNWDDVFKDALYLEELSYGHMWHSDDSIELMRKAYQYCVPGNAPTSEIIKEAESIHRDKRFKRPHCFQMSDEGKQKFMKVFGKAKYDEMIGQYADKE
ncbi:MAG: hypothetical protein WCM76_02500 [Bacteroidota bacterium]